MFSTLMSLEDRLRLKLKVKLMYGYNEGPPMVIPVYVHSTTVLCDRVPLHYYQVYWILLISTSLSNSASQGRSATALHLMTSDVLLSSFKSCKASLATLSLMWGCSFRVQCPDTLSHHLHPLLYFFDRGSSKKVLLCQGLQRC